MRERGEREGREDSKRKESRSEKRAFSSREWSGLERLVTI